MNPVCDLCVFVCSGCVSRLNSAAAKCCAASVAALSRREGNGDETFIDLQPQKPPLQPDTLSHVALREPTSKHTHTHFVLCMCVAEFG